MTQVYAFVGPSLAAEQVERLGAVPLPPARHGDVWRALRHAPEVVALALVDGVFEGVPSVWHKELLDALEAGVAAGERYVGKNSFILKAELGKSEAGHQH